MQERSRQGPLGGILAASREGKMEFSAKMLANAHQGEP